MGINVRQGSRLKFGTFYRSGGADFWDLLTLPLVPVRNDDTQYVVREGDYIDNLAYDFYGNENLWWFLAHANNMELLPTELKIGQVLRVPSRRYVTDEYLKLTPKDL